MILVIKLQLDDFFEKYIVIIVIICFSYLIVNYVAFESIKEACLNSFPAGKPCECIEELGSITCFKNINIAKKCLINEKETDCNNLISG